MAPSRQRVDDAGKQYRERPPSAAVREAADEHDVVSAAAVTTRQQLQAQYGRAEVDLAIAGEDQSAFGTFILAEWAMGAAGLGIFLVGAALWALADSPLLHVLTI